VTVPALSAGQADREWHTARFGERWRLEPVRGDLRRLSALLMTAPTIPHRPANLILLAVLSDRKGRIAAGTDADIVVWDVDAQRTLDVEAMHMGIDYEPYEGRTVRGWPRGVITNGRVAMRDGTFTDPGPTGARLSAGPVF
jgi:N-acyl-D-aspartate/D-glutamate deacylase